MHRIKNSYHVVNVVPVVGMISSPNSSFPGINCLASFQKTGSNHIRRSESGVSFFETTHAPHNKLPWQKNHTTPLLLWMALKLLFVDLSTQLISPANEHKRHEINDTSETKPLHWSYRGAPRDCRKSITECMTWSSDRPSFGRVYKKACEKEVGFLSSCCLLLKSLTKYPSPFFFLHVKVCIKKNDPSYRKLRAGVQR